MLIFLVLRMKKNADSFKTQKHHKNNNIDVTFFRFRFVKFAPTETVT